MNAIIDGHLDIAMNAMLYERDQALRLEELWRHERGGTGDGRGTATVSLPELRQAGAMIVIATLIARCKPWVDPMRTIGRCDLDYPVPAMTYAAARCQLAYYHQLQEQRQVRIIGNLAQLEAHTQQWLAPGIVTPMTAAPAGAADSSLLTGLILLMEGADPIVYPQQLHEWHKAGLRLISLAHFGHSRYAAGTPSPDPASPEQDGPVTELGLQLLKEMDDLKMILDLSHLSDTSFFQATEAYHGPVCATHCNCRAITPSVRQLTDRQLKLIIDRGGVIGCPMHYGMLHPDFGKGRSVHPDEVSLDHAASHIDHICQLAGSSEHVGIGSDLDGGFGAEATPRELDRYSDLQKLEPVLRSRGFTEEDIVNIFYNNWLRLLRNTLPMQG